MNIKQIIITITLSLSTLFSQSISTQGVLRDANGYALATAQYNLTFRIYDSLTGGELKWTGVYANHPVTNGVFNAILGDYDSNPIAMLDGDGSYWLSIQIESDGEMSPRLDLNISPYEMAYLDGSQNVFPPAGNVGIGTTDPNLTLEVMGYIRNNVGGNYDLWIQGGPSLSAGESRNLAILGDVTNDRLIINNGGDYTGGTILGGNVGIGTISPSNKLSVDGNADFTGNVGIGINIPSFKLHVKDTDYPLYLESDYGFGKFGAFTDAFYSFTDRPTFYFNKKLIIDSGDYDNAQVLNLKGGDSGGSTSLNIKNFTSNDSQGQWYFDPGVGGQIYFGTTDGTTEIERVNIDGELVVGGYLMAPNMRTMSGSNNVRISATGELFKESSSLRYKQNINEWNDHRNILNANVKTFQMKEGYGDPSENHIGLIAEEMHDIGLNHLVIYDQENRPEAVFYNRVSLYLLGIVKEQDKEINEMKSRMASIEADLAKLK